MENKLTIYNTLSRQKGQKDGEALCELGERYLYGKNGTIDRKSTV